MEMGTLPKKKSVELSPERMQHRLAAEASLEYFINLVHPNRYLGNIHREVIQWWCREGAKSHQLLLLPRDHMKSAMVAYRVAWELTRDPTLRVLYISSTSNLAIKQLKFIKDIFTNDTYRLYWPDMVVKDEAKREKWTEREISLDHPRRKEEHIRDPSIFTAGLTSNIVGLHCDIAVLDDVVVQSNAYTEEGREKVSEQYGYLSSIEGTGAREWVVGTRYHPTDLYSSLLARMVVQYDEFGNTDHERTRELFEVFGGDDVRKIRVESIGDGTGEFLWPRQLHPNGRWYGFNSEELATKRSSYSNLTHFRAQYYNDPRDAESAPIQRDLFQYYDVNYLSRRDGKLYFKGERLNVVAAVDFAFTTGKRSDYSSVVVVGLDGNGNYYVLDIDRFKTDKISEYFNRILRMYEKWGFRKIRCEVSVAQQVIVKDLKDNYIKPHGLSLIVDEFRPSRFQGTKEERILAVLEPKYANRQIWHYTPGNCQLLEEELVYANPAHDDIKDALASAIDFAVPPLNMFSPKFEQRPNMNFHPRWGGVA